MRNCKLNAVSFGLALAVLWALVVLVMGITAMTIGYGASFVGIVGQFYIGYSASVLGIIIGIVWAFIDAFLGGLIFAWLYNKFSSWCKGCQTEGETQT